MHHETDLNKMNSEVMTEISQKYQLFKEEDNLMKHLNRTEEEMLEELIRVQNNPLRKGRQSPKTK